MLAWMIADGMLEVRIAVPTGKLEGDYHPKMGCFIDSIGNKVVFHGSQNETERGFRNFEILDVFTSWSGEHEAQRIKNHQTRFKRIWNRHDPHVRCHKLPDAIRRQLVKFTDNQSRPYRKPSTSYTAPSKWRHQDQAVTAFLNNKAGILAMATGTGKTRTAIKIAEELIERDLIESILVTTSGTDLLNQWYKVLIREGPGWPSYRQYDVNKEAGAYLGRPRSKILIVSRQMIADVLIKLRPSARDKTLLICDEVHGLGSYNLRHTLTGYLSPFPYRLGLSATPERDYDIEGNEFLASEIGIIIYRFELQDAIARGILCELDYIPLYFSLSEQDQAKRARLIRAHEAAKANGTPRPVEELYRQLADVKKSSVEKLPALSSFLKNRPETVNRSLVFVPTIEYGEMVQRLVSEHTDEFHPYFSGDHRNNLIRFAEGDLDCLLTCHRLSEGIDIHSVRTVFLVSADRARIETVQRLGRCLRIDENDLDKRALVVDLICENDETDLERSRWISEIAQTRRKS